MPRPSSYAFLAVVALLTGIGACSGEDVFDDPIYPSRPINTPPDINSFLPDSSVIDAEIGDTIHFAITATDSEEDVLEFQYSLEASVVSRQSSWIYIVGSPGTVTIEAIASDGSLSDSVSWQLNRLKPPDVTPPGPVTVDDVGVTNYSKLWVDLFVVWTDLGHEIRGGEASSYVVRYAETPVTNESAWLLAQDVNGEPAPGVPGQLRSMMFRVPMFPDRMWVAIRAIDAAGNMSALGSPGSVQWSHVSGVIRDAVTGDPIEGVTVTTGGLSDHSGADGSYRVQILTEGPRHVSVRDELLTGPYGTYFDIDGDINISAGEHDFWMLPNISLTTTKYDDFLTFFWLMTVERNRMLYGTRLLTWELPFDVYIPPRTANGIDFQKRMKDAYAVWESITGKDLVTFVDSEPAVGVFVDWSLVDGRSVYFVLERDDDYFPIRGKIQMASDHNTGNVKVFDRVAIHEAGHSLILDHSSDGNHLMVGFRAVGVDAPSDDEIALIKAIYNIPRGTQTKHFKHE